MGRSRLCPLLQLFMRPCDRAWPPFTAFCPPLCPEAPACPLTPSRIGRLFATSLQALQLPECSRDTPVCSLFPGGIHLGHARVSVYGLRCLRLPLGSGLLLMLAACAPAKELRRPSCPRLPPPALTQPQVACSASQQWDAGLATTWPGDKNSLVGSLLPVVAWSWV